MARLSVILTNYNHAAFIGRAIESIVNQSRQPEEFIIQDDASTDNSVDVIMSYVRKYRFIRFVQNEKNYGAIKAMEKVSTYATGDYLYGAGADDYTLPGFFEEAMSLCEQYPDAGLCCGNPTAYIRETGELYETKLMWSGQTAYIRPEVLPGIINGQCIQGHTAIMRRDAFVNAGGFNPDHKWHSDWFFNLVIAFRHGIIYMPHSVAVDNARRDGAYCFTGSQNSSEQNAVLSAILRSLLDEKFRDVLPSFVHSGVLYPFTKNIVNTVMNNREFWNSEILMLMIQPLFYWNNELVKIRNDRAQIAAARKVDSLIHNCQLLLHNNRKSDALSILSDLIQLVPQDLRVQQLLKTIT
jgi:glycosyltransferase involved in cell wall biosynthesis